MSTLFIQADKVPTEFKPLTDCLGFDAVDSLENAERMRIVQARRFSVTCWPSTLR